MSRLTLALATVLAGLALAPAGAQAARDPVDHSAGRAPDGTPLCASWVHDRYSVTVNGRRFATWHPPRDPRYRCAFGHEHGSNPRAFRFFRRTGMPAFDRMGPFTGRSEPHAGFKVFAANDDRHGLSWMVVLHQGSFSPRRGSARYHSAELWLFRNRDRKLIAHTRHLADFGNLVANCPGARLSRAWRLLPSPGCAPTREEWAAALDVGGVFTASPIFTVENPITQLDPADPGRVVLNKAAACGPGDPAGWDSRCKGDERAVLHPEWRVRNRGAARFRTDAYGRRSARGIPQFVSPRVSVNQRGERGGVENTFVMRQPTDGGLYRAGRGVRSKGFEFRSYCLLRNN